jgi:DNA-damage-inducible protein J
MSKSKATTKSAALRMRTHKTATINARIEPKLKAEAEHILDEVGLSSADAIRIFYKQVCLKKGLPFSVNIPNATTAAAMKDAKDSKTRKAKNVAEIFEDLE